jgi:hypothetical protein
MRDSFTVRQDLTFSDFFSSMMYYYFSGKLLKRIFLFIAGVIVFSMLLGIATTSNGIDLLTLMSSFLPLLIVVLIVIAGVFFICLNIYKSKPYLFQNVSYDFTHWGVVRRGENTEFSKPWRDITKFKETKAFILLYVGNSDVHIIQKKMFANGSELNDFRQLLQDNIRN